jgi:hypothetical protein
MCFKYLDHIGSTVATFTDCFAFVGTVLRAQLLPFGLDLLEIGKGVAFEKVTAATVRKLVLELLDDFQPAIGHHCDLHVVGIVGVPDGLLALDTLNEKLLQNPLFLFVLCHWFCPFLVDDDEDDEEIPATMWTNLSWT